MSSLTVAVVIQGRKYVDELLDCCKRGRDRVLAAHGDLASFQKKILERFPLSLGDQHVTAVGVEHGWQDAWMQKPEKRRGRKAEAEAVATAASQDVGNMLASAVSCQGEAPQVQQQPQPPQQPPEPIQAPQPPPPTPVRPPAPATPPAPRDASAFVPRNSLFSPAPATPTPEPSGETGAVAAEEIPEDEPPETPAPHTSSKAAPPLAPATRATPDCTFCWEPMVRGGQPVSVLPCMHCFHQACLAEWRDVNRISNMSKCPMGCHKSQAVRVNMPGIPGMFAQQQQSQSAHAVASDDGSWEVDSDEGRGSHGQAPENWEIDEDAESDEPVIR